MTQPWMFIVFFTVVLSLFGLMQYRLFRVFRKWTGRAFHEARQITWRKNALRILLAANALFILQFPLRVTSLYDEPLIQAILVYPSGLFFAAIVLSFLLVLVSDIVRLVIRLVRRITVRTQGDVQAEPHVDENRRKFIARAGVSAAAAVGSFPVFASLLTARDYQINRLNLSFPDYPSELDGLTIAHISDIHSGIYMTEQDMNEIVELSNGLRPDIVMITGDFVDSADSQIEPLSNALKNIQAGLAVYGCLGNHDHFATAEKVNAAVEQRGILMLNNSHEKVFLDNGRITIAGIDDAGRGMAHFADFDRALAGVDPESFTILLTHRPDVWDESRARGMQLTLAGHTHGGQVGFRVGPLNMNPVHLVHKYAMGLYTEGDKQLYVNVGVGMVGVPIRMVRPEIALITLKHA